MWADLCRVRGASRVSARKTAGAQGRKGDTPALDYVILLNGGVQVSRFPLLDAVGEGGQLLCGQFPLLGIPAAVAKA